MDPPCLRPSGLVFYTADKGYATFVPAAQAVEGHRYIFIQPWKDESSMYIDTMKLNGNNPSVVNTFKVEEEDHYSFVIRYK